MSDAVLTPLVDTLVSAGLAAIRGYPEDVLDRGVGPVICCGIRSSKLLSAGAGDYLGERTEGGCVSEVYGLRMEIVLALDIYSPDDGHHGAAGCEETADAVSEALPALPAGLKVRATVRGETEFDEKLEMFHAAVELHCAAFLTREIYRDVGTFTDFKLRGVRA